MEASLTGKALNFGFNDYGFESRASNLNSNFWLPYLINQINLNLAKKSLKFYIFFNKSNILLLNIFQKLGVILSYSIVQKNGHTRIMVYLYYYKKTLFFKNFKLISSASHSYYITSHMLRMLNKRMGNSILLLSCNQGIVTQKTALSKNIGGKLLLMLL